MLFNLIYAKLAPYWYTETTDMRFLVHLLYFSIIVYELEYTGLQCLVYGGGWAQVSVEAGGAGGHRERIEGGGDRDEHDVRKSG